MNNEMEKQSISTRQTLQKNTDQNGRFPTVSIIISNFNGRDLLRDCLVSLLRQDYLGAVEIIVVDAGSTDGTPEMIKLEFPEVKLIREGRIGIAKALNLGLRRARGEILAFDINSDEILSPTWLQTLVNALLRIPYAGVVGGIRVFYGTKDIVDDAGATFNYFGISSNYIRVRLSDVPKYPRKVDYVGAPLFRRKILNTVGLCDENYFLYSEDEDFCARVKRFGYDVVLIPQAISYHRRSATIGKAEPLSTYYERRNHIRFIIIHFSLLRMFLALFWYVIVLTAIEAFTFVPFIKRLVSSKESRLSFLSQRATKQNFRAIIAAIVWNFRNIKSTISVRQQIAKISRPHQMSVLRN
jgi:GT2 family glycosyltransferase